MLSARRPFTERVNCLMHRVVMAGACVVLFRGQLVSLSFAEKLPEKNSNSGIRKVDATQVRLLPASPFYDRLVK